MMADRVLPEFERLIVRRVDGSFDNWREVVRRDTGECIGWLQRDTWGSVVSWDAYTPDKEWLQSTGSQADAVRFLRTRREPV